MIIFLQ
jgi:spectrin alpha